MPGTMSRFSPALESISDSPIIRINNSLAKNNSINAGDSITLFSDLGEVGAKAHLAPYLPDNTAFLTNHYKSTGFLKLFRYNKVPFTKTPCMYSIKTGIKRGD